MPNWCRNKVKLIGEHAQEARRMMHKKNKVSFEKLLPLPKELENTVSPNPNQNSKESKYLKEKYGADNWYDWCIKNWGCKWEPTDSNEYDGYIVFETPWCPPGHFLEKLSETFPDIEIICKWADEFSGNGAGEFILKNGEYIQDNVINNEDFWEEIWT